LSAGADYYFWDFGDGTTSTTSDPVISHTYLNNTGATVVYSLSLTVENEQGCTDTLTREITVHPELTAEFLADRLEGCSPLEVAFTNLSVNAATSYWDFGDGASSIETDPVHTFTNNGTADTVYLVTLITTSGDGLCVKEVSWPIRVHGVAEAAFSVSGGIDCTPSQITFENLSTGGMNHIWDFGDGTTISTAGPVPVTHTFVNNSFSEIREFQVTLLAEHYAGCNSQWRQKRSGFIPT
jgi:PKD repeat protein